MYGINGEDITTFCYLLLIARPVKVLAYNKLTSIETCLSSK
jgi:hypothetical protein